jgi:hypothetical protein
MAGEFAPLVLALFGVGAGCLGLILALEAFERAVRP